MRRIHFAVLTALLALAAACATSGADGSADPSPNAITLEEIRDANAPSVYQLVQELHPAWLRGRGQTSIQGPDYVVVYMENARIGGPDALRRVGTDGVSSVRFLDPAAAQFEFGSGHPHGAIVILR